MARPPVFIVHLRRPRKSDPNETRSDPFWEFGSFGCTGCHSKNLLNKKNAARLQGARLAFAQGGAKGFRLVFLTPAIHVQHVGNRLELKWSPGDMPFKYAAAPVLVDNHGSSEIPALEKIISRVQRTTPEGRFSSCFRSRSLPLLEHIADQLVATYDNARRRAKRGEIASCYSEALPFPPNIIDKKRRHSYERIHRELIAQAGSSSCRKADQKWSKGKCT